MAVRQGERRPSVNVFDLKKLMDETVVTFRGRLLGCSISPLFCFLVLEPTQTRVARVLLLLLQHPCASCTGHGEPPAYSCRGRCDQRRVSREDAALSAMGGTYAKTNPTVCQIVQYISYLYCIIPGTQYEHRIITVLVAVDFE